MTWCVKHKLIKYPNSYYVTQYLPFEGGKFRNNDWMETIVKRVKVTQVFMPWIMMINLTAYMANERDMPHSHFLPIFTNSNISLSYLLTILADW